MSFLLAYDALVARFADESCNAVRENARADFERRTGAFAPEDAWFEARSRAFIDDALTNATVLAALLPGMQDDLLAYAKCFARAHRGLFEVDDIADDGCIHLVCVWSGAELLVTSVDESTRIALSAAHGLFDARVVGRGDPVSIAMLPGALFHGEEASDAIDGVLAAAKKRGLGTTDTLDALLRMEHKLRTLSRMKASYAYREDRLTNQHE